MARGWESKAIESQQDEAAREKRPRRALTEAERAALERRRLLELALANARADLSAARAPAHREMLAGKIAALESEIARTAAVEND
jgi:hypothetical protein